jgi:serine/threonine protein kinase
MDGPIDLEPIALDICKNRNLAFNRLIGEGSFKQSYLVYDIDGNPLALKVYKSGRIDERSKREIDAMQRCDHPGIAHLYEIDVFAEERSRHLFTLEEFLGGGTLTSRINEYGLLEASETIEIGSQLLLAIAHLRELNLVHRDLKPDNILFRDDGKTPVITDFGIVRVLDDTSVTMSWLLQGPGTPFYAAAEQLKNEKRLIDWRTDQFSLGVLLSVCTFGRHPYMRNGMSDEDTVRAVAERETVSPAFIEFVEETGLIALKKMVLAWPAERYLTPDELIVVWKSQEV